MISLEEIYERMNKDDDTEEEILSEKSWQPTILEEYEVPFFNIPDSKYRNENLSKVLTFIKSVEHIRSKDYCTIMPITTVGKKNLGIWGKPRNVSNAIAYMISIGLIDVYDDRFQFRCRNHTKNKCKLYRYYVENEKKIKEFCYLRDIHPFCVNNYYEIQKPSKSSNLNMEDFRFSSSYRLRIPNDMNKIEFEQFIYYSLYNNYPALEEYQKKADIINNTFLKDYPSFQIKFVPTIKYEKNQVVLHSIGIRATNSLCNKETPERDAFNIKNGFSLSKDIKSSIPRITLSLNKQQWIDNDIDIYEEIYRAYDENEEFTDYKRKVIKELHMRAYFEQSIKTLINHIWLQMDTSNIIKDDIKLPLEKLKNAVETVEEKLYGNEIFFIESCICIDTLYDLLNIGFLTYSVYDSFYSNNDDIGMTQDSYNELVDTLLEENFNNYLHKYVLEKNKRTHIKSHYAVA